MDYYGLRRFPGETDCEGFCRIISDSDPVSSRLQPAGEIDRKWRKQAVAGSQEWGNKDIARQGYASLEMSPFDRGLWKPDISRPLKWTMAVLKGNLKNAKGSE